MPGGSCPIVALLPAMVSRNCLLPLFASKCKFTAELITILGKAVWDFTGKNMKPSGVFSSLEVSKF